MFSVKWFNSGEMSLESNEFKSIIYDVHIHKVIYETCSGVTHVLSCDFSSIYARLHEIVKSNGFKYEKPYKCGTDGDYYKFEYDYKGVHKDYEGYIYGLILHEEIVDLVSRCAKGVLKDERKLLDNNWGRNVDGTVEDWALYIMSLRYELCEKFMGIWEDINE